MALFSSDEQARIAAAVAAAEAHTAGELVVAVVPQSATYAPFRAAAAAAWTVALALAVHLSWVQVSATWLLLAQLPVAALAYWVMGRGAVLRWLVPRARIGEAVQARAMQLFAERGVHHTRDHSGLLIMISEREHRVIMVGDRGIHARVGTAGWEQHVAHVVAGIRQGRAAAAVMEVIDALGQVLARDFPRRPDDTNELANEVVRAP